MSLKAHTIGTPVRVTKIITDDGDTRNLSRSGVIADIILDESAHSVGNTNILYAVEFTDGVSNEPQHWIDAEAGLPLNQSSHYHSELETRKETKTDKK